MCRTTVNVTGDAAVSLMVAKSVNKMGPPNVKEWDDNYHPDRNEDDIPNTVEEKEKV